jgi:anti-sigma B factor antagonist
VPDLTLTVDTAPSGQRVLDVRGPLDLSTAHRLQRTVATMELGSGLVIDLSGVTYCDSTGLTALIGAYQRSRAEHIGFAVSGAGRDLARVFQIVGIDQIMAMYDTVEQAATALSSEAGPA